MLSGTVHVSFIQPPTQQVFTEHLLSVGHVLGTGDTAENETEKTLYLAELAFSWDGQREEESRK